MTAFVFGSMRITVSAPWSAADPPPRVRKKAASAAPISVTPTTAAASGQRLRFGSAIPSACRAASTSSWPAREAVVGLLREGGAHHVLEPRRGRRLLLEMGEEHRRVGEPGERRPAGQALVEQAAERVEVGAAVHLLAADLLRGDVVDRAERLGRAERRARLAQAPGEAEVGQVGVPALVERARSRA